jgi:hypothetical protein
MLGILKVNAGIGTDGTAEFSLTVVDTQERVYEVQIDDIAYAQIVGVIEESTGQLSPEAPVPAAPEDVREEAIPSNGAGQISPEKRAMLAEVIAGTPQHAVEGEEQHSPVSMADVGFDIDYSAEMGEYADEDEFEDPGEELAGPEDDYVEPL